MSHVEPPKAIIFDLLTALLDSWTAWDQAAAHATGSDSRSTQQLGRNWRNHYLNLTYNCGPYRPYTTLVHEAAALAHLPPSAANHLESNWDHTLKPWPEVRAVLTRLRAAGYKLAVVTNCSVELGRRAIQACESAVGDGFEFDATVTAEEVGFYKPRPETYLAVLKKLGVAPEQAVFVAGSSGDVPGAGGVGMRVFWHNRVGLEGKEGAVPLKEGRTLDETLSEFVSGVSES